MLQTLISFKKKEVSQLAYILKCTIFTSPPPNRADNHKYKIN